MVDTYIFYLNCALGNFNTSAYDAYDQDGTKIESVSNRGVIFLFIFLLFNMVIMLNFVIAILGDTFNQFNPLINGLYLVVLISQFP